MNVVLLASGSRGNALLLSSGSTRILVDAGLSAREICRRLEYVGAAPDSIDALLVTHEHSDHIRGLGPLARRLKLPVFLHTEVAGTLKDVGVPANVREFEEGQEFLIGDLAIRSFPITHDARSPVGFVVDSARGKLGIATDLGIATRLVAERLTACRALVLESNHDEDLLRDGPYPWQLKQRVSGKHGHLSNRDSAELLRGLLWDGLEAVLLAHLSETNNSAELARSVAAETLAGQSLCAPELLVGQPGIPVSWTG